MKKLKRVGYYHFPSNFDKQGNIKMAAKNTTAAASAAGAEKGAGAAQIMQNLISIKTTQDDVLVKEHGQVLKNILEAIKALAASQIKLEGEMSNVSTAVKAAGAQKRAPKAPVTGDGATTGAVVSTVPAGEKFPSTSYAWFGNNYKRDPAGSAAKYFVDAQVKAMRDKLATNDTYNKLNVSTGTPEAQEKAKEGRLVLEAKELIAIVRNDTAIAAKIKEDWTQAKSDWEKKSRTAAPKDGEADATPAATS